PAPAGDGGAVARGPSGGVAPPERGGGARGARARRVCSGRTAGAGQQARRETGELAGPVGHGLAEAERRHRLRTQVVDRLLGPGAGLGRRSGRTRLLVAVRVEPLTDAPHALLAVEE